jgi:hypothetical protein
MAVVVMSSASGRRCVRRLTDYVGRAISVAAD